MSIRAALGWVFVAAAASWLSVYDRPARDSAEVVKSEPQPAALPQVPRPRQPPQPQAAPPPRTSPPVTPSRPVQPVQAPDEPSAGVAEPHVQAQRDVWNAARDLAVTKAKLRLDSEPLDEGRTDELQRRYAARFDERRFGVRPEIRCVKSLCKVSLETADAAALAEVDQIHGDLGVQPLTTVDGDPAQGIIRSVSYYLLDDQALKDVVGADPRGVLTPGS